MTIWKAGMLAVCVHGGKYKPSNIGSGPWPEEGRIYKVRGVGEGIGRGGPCLFLDLVNGPVNGVFGQIWNAARFRPAVQDWQSEKQSKTSKLDDMLKGRVPV